MAMSRTDASIEPTRNGNSSSKNRSGDVSSASSDSSSFADETTVSGEYRDDSTHHALPARNPSEDDAEAAMITKNKISNTGRWKLFVVALMFVNTTVVIAATSLFLNNEADKEFDRAVRRYFPIVIVFMLVNEALPGESRLCRGCGGASD